MSLNPILLILIATSLGIQVAGAQLVSLTLTSAAANPNDVVFLDLSLLSTEDAVEPASLQWQLGYSQSDFTSMEVIAGPAAVAAKKTVVCQGNAQGLLCAALGLADGHLNRSVIENGVLARVRLQVPSSQQSGPLSVRLVNSFGASAGAESIAAAGAEATVSVGKTVSPAINLTSIVCEPTATKPGDAIICAIRLSDSAPPDGATIEVLTGDEALQAPTLVHLRSGQHNLRFRADVSPTSKSQTVSITASLGDSTAGENITVSAGVTPILILPPPQTAIYGEQMQLQLLAKDPGGSPITFSATMLPGGSLVTQDGNFLWTPQLSDRGTHAVRFWATNANGLSTSRELTIRVVDRKPEITGIVNAASQSAQAPCSPGGLATLFGTGITKNPPESAPAGPLSSTLSDVRVEVNGNPVPLLFASSTQVNFQCPGLAPGSALNVTVESGLGVSPPVQSTMQPASPGIFTLDAAGQGSIIVADRQAVAMIRNASLLSEPAMPGDYVSIFATGLGPVSGVIVEGQEGPADPLATVQGYVEVWIGDQPAEVQFAGLAPGFVGAYQVNAKVPANLSTADRTPVTLLLRPPGGTVLESNKVTMAVESR